jgi:hypothetical protein
VEENKMSGTNPLFKADDTKESWDRPGFVRATARFFAAQAGSASQLPFEEVVPSNAAGHTTDTSFVALTGFGDVSVIGVSTGQQAATLFSMAVGEVIPAVVNLRSYAWKAPALSSLATRLGHSTASEATAFSNAEVVRGPWEPKLIQYLRYLRLFFRRPFGEVLAARLEALAQMMREDDDQCELSVMSVANLIGFLEKNRVSRPRLAVGPSGEIVAFWRSDGEGEFSARFLSSGSVRFLVTKKNPKHPEGVSRSSGDTTLDELFARAGLADLRWTLEN